jgi:hypothetical protein
VHNIAAVRVVFRDPADNRGQESMNQLRLEEVLELPQV